MTADRVLELVADAFYLEVGDLTGSRGDAHTCAARTIAYVLLTRRCALYEEEVAALLGRTPRAVRLGRRRLPRVLAQGYCAKYEALEGATRE